MYKTIHLSKDSYRDNKTIEECACNDNSLSYKIIENYRSILDRKQKFISTWKIYNQNGKISFKHGTLYRKDTDALVIRLNHICLINPWYKYMNINKNLPVIFKQNQCKKIYEIVLLECNCLKNLNEYELAIIECPCLIQLRNYCHYCRVILSETEEFHRLLKDVEQQTDISFSLEFFNENFNMDESFSSQPGPCEHQRTVQIQLESEQVLQAINEYEVKLSNTKKIIDMLEILDENVDDFSSETKSIGHLYNNSLKRSSSQLEDTLSSEKSIKYKNKEIQTKLFAIFLPESPLSEIQSSNIDIETIINVTRSCQVNTLSYLIKENQNQTDLQHSKRKEYMWDSQNRDCSLSTSPLHVKTEFIKVISSEEMSLKAEKQGMNIPTIQFEEEKLQEKLISILVNEEISPIAEQSEEPALTLPSLKCINACDTIDLDEPNTSLSSSFIDDDDTISRRISSNLLLHHFSSLNNNSKILTTDHVLPVNYQTSKLFRLISRKRRQYRNKKRIYTFLRRLYRHKSKQSCLSSDHQTQSQVNTIKSKLSSHYKASNHIITARATKNSSICNHFQTLLNNPDTPVEDILHSQLLLTCNSHCKSVCILIDDHKQSEKCRTTFLHYIYQSLSNTLKEILHQQQQQSVHMSCMNLVFFNNSICDIINMRRLRLIDTGTNIILHPSCEIPLKTSQDINNAIKYLNTNMSFAHQLFIINFSNQQLSYSSSFLFLQIAPICSIRPTGLLINLNFTTYSLLNLIRKFTNEKLFPHHQIKRYLFNDNALNRLLKMYLFSSEQSMTVLTVNK